MTSQKRDVGTRLRFWLARQLVGGSNQQPQRVKYMTGAASYAGYYRAMADKLGELKPTDEGLALAIEASVWAYRCVDARAKAVSQMPWYIKNKITGEPIENTAYHRAFDYAYQTFGQNLHYNWEMALSVQGENYLEKLTRDDSLPGGLKWLNPLAVDPYIQGNQILYFEYQDNEGHITRFQPNEVVFDKYANILDDFRGNSPMTKALDAVNIDRMMQRYIKAFFKNDGTMGGYLTGRDGQTISQTDQDRLMTWWKEQVVGADNAFKTLFLPAPLDYHEVDNKPPEGQEVMDENQRRRIHAAFFVPMSMTGAAGVSDPLGAGATMDAQKAGFYEAWAIPECDDRAMVINTKIMPWFDRTGLQEFCFDYSYIQSLIKQTKERSEKVRGEYKDNVITLNEARIELGYGEIEGGDVFAMPSGVMLVTKENLPKMAMSAPPIPMDDAAPAPGVDVSVPQLPAGELPAKDAQTDGQSLCIMLDLADDVNLLDLQNNVKRLLGDTPVRWNPAKEFHITLFYAPSVTPAQMDAVKLALEAVPMPEMALRVGSLNTFDNLGEHAVHFRIRNNEDLNDFQESIYNLCSEQGIQPSAYSVPAQYKPHITMGYAETRPRAVTFVSRLTVQPKAMILAAGDTAIARFGEQQPEPVKTDSQPTLEEPAESPAVTSTKANELFEELERWQRKVKNAGDPRKSFTCYAIPKSLAALIEGRLYTTAAEDKDAIRSIFQDAHDRLMLKAIQATRLDFEDDFEDMLAAARSDELTRRRFGSILRDLIRKYGTQAYKDGLADGGIELDEGGGLEEDDQVEVNLLVASQSEYVTNIGATLFNGDGVSDDQAEAKPAMWFNKSIMPFYQAGLTSADSDSLYEWVYGDTEHCEDCARLNGQRHRLKAYAKRNLIPPTELTTCKGFHCKCKLVRAKGKAKGTW